jgi:hypothetical protein
MFTITLSEIPRPCSHKTLAETVVGQMDAPACKELIAAAADDDLKLLAFERLGFLLDGY